MFITAFTRTIHLSLSWGRTIRSMPPHPNSLKVFSNITFPSAPSSSKLSLSLGSPHRNPVCAFPVPHSCHVGRQSHIIWWLRKTFIIVSSNTASHWASPQRGHETTQHRCESPNFASRRRMRVTVLVKARWNDGAYRVRHANDALRNAHLKLSDI